MHAAAQNSPVYSQDTTNGLVAIADDPEAVAQLAHGRAITENSELLKQLEQLAAAETDDERADRIAHSAANVETGILATLPVTSEEMTIFKDVMLANAELLGRAGLRQAVETLLEASVRCGSIPQADAFH